MNRFPRTDFGLIDLERYFDFRGGRRLDYCSSQGCPFQCTFCADPQVYAQRWSGLKPERVVAEIAEPGRAAPALRGLLQRRQLLHGPPPHRGDLPRPAGRARAASAGSAPAAADLLRRLTDEQLALLRESGCYKINVGAESGSPELLRQIKKGTLVEEVLETAEKLHRFGHRRALLVHRRLPAGAGRQPGRHLPDRQGAARDRRRFRDADLLLRAVSGHGAGRSACPRSASRRRAASRSWREVDFDHSIGPWIPGPVRKLVPRYNFYLRHGYERPGRSWSRRLLHRVARAPRAGGTSMRSTSSGGRSTSGASCARASHASSRPSRRTEA